MNKSITNAGPSKQSKEQMAEQSTNNVRKLNGNQGIQVIARAADILRALKAEPDGLSLGQIASRVNLPRSTVQRIVSALSAEHLVVTSATEGGLFAISLPVPSQRFAEQKELLIHYLLPAVADAGKFAVQLR